MLLLAAVLASAKVQLTERHIIQLALRPGERRDYAFPVPNSAVIFATTAGFHALLGTGQGRVRQFGVVDGRTPVLGGFFGSRLGKLRIIADSDCRIIFYALVPPVSDCQQIYITSDTSKFELSPHEQANASITPGSVHCMWHISPWNLSYYFNQDGVNQEDRFDMWALNKDPTKILGTGQVVSRGGIDFFLFRADRKDAGRVIDRTIVMADRPGIPVVAAALTAGAKSAVIAEFGAAVQTVETSGEGFTARLSLGALFAFMVAVGAIVAIIIFGTVLVIARLRDPPRQAHDGEQRLLSESSGWPFQGNAGRPIGIPTVLAQNAVFPTA
jgi:hypothetical protein